MTWYGVTVVMAVRFKIGQQDPIPAWENIYLVNAPDADQAAAKAEAIGRANEGDSEGSFYWDERPAEWVYKGVRKIVEISNSHSIQKTPGDGAEITYQTLEFQNEQALANYMDGHTTTVKVID